MLQNKYDTTRGNMYCSERRGGSFTIRDLRVHLRYQTQSSSTWTLTGTKYVYCMTRGDYTSLHIEGVNVKVLHLLIYSISFRTLLLSPHEIISLKTMEYKYHK